MTNVDTLVAALGEDAGYPSEAADRLETRLASEPRPRDLGRRRALAATLAFVAAATLGGAGMGAAIELHQSPAASPLLPATQSGTAAALLFGGG